ncbi:amino acid synthesis family protein [Alisedimentitalea sp. MJ-SS2]|uniref:amino acid synthesis family protein n=1 Tax=Aliisedimentitalea sp. MJ-SS2 TaxID=3049795 RepID=UPI002912F546|nr:amino acid synthesis family protein [Alisedimentitalea sp. MJ-SS2]MDU8929879.1 amino acid synthesis family protein [Alisedimentitalea sp. MJ-SS2]
MPELKLRKTIESREEIWHEGGEVADTPYVRACVMAVIENPFAGGFVQDIQPFMEDLKPLGLSMAERLIKLIGGADLVEGYGKGAIIGSGGEIEHGALWHAPGGYAMRQLLGAERSKAIVPSTKKVGGVGARLDVPVTHITASYVRSHFDSIEVGCNDAPKRDEIALILVMTNGARVHSRSGGLEAWDIKGEDGLR